VRSKDFLSIYTADGLIKTVAAEMTAPGQKNIRLRNLSGSLDAVVLASCFTLNPRDYLVIMQDREEAAYSGPNPRRLRVGIRTSPDGRGTAWGRTGPVPASRTP